MMTRYIAVSGIVLTFGGAVHKEETLTGTWQGETRSGTSIVLTLSVKGTALTGTLSRNDEISPLSDGKVSKRTFTFKATVNGQTEGFSGELVKGEIKIWMDRQGASNAIYLRRAENEAVALSRGRPAWAKDS